MVGNGRDVVRSLERLYAVPSEKLRVWSIWLSKIGEIADEWQRWLRAHIDFAIRLMEQLQAAEEALSRSNVEEGDQPAEVSSRDGEEEAAEVPQEAGDSDRATLPAKSVVSLQEPAEEAADGEEVAEEEETKEEVDDAGEASDEAVEDIGEKGDESEDAGRKMWPLGRPWEHLGLEDEIDEEPFVRLPLPRSESEMSQFLKMFTHEATVYRSYYKHWRETADRAIDEIGGRTVMATFVVQGKDEHGQIKKQKPAPPKPKFGKRSKTTIKKSTTKSPEEPPRRESSDSNGEQFYTPLSSEVAIDELPNPGTPTNGATRESSKVEMPTEEPASSKAQLSKAEMSKVRVIEVTDLVKDCARAQEPLPYIFYLKAEPDIDIAIEHDDVVVIEEDTDRENIVGDFRRVFFNLTDKPCKGGKPWMF
ncbi:hypothetical protein WH47_08947 [Habropoda laboriosa]|uniref:Uncharacterized protein n=1 Tax=Habropoda laboriosa TaxID=597456 RepID=A0A0L7R6V1_9HYME|nr:hypothetical protein WH47_08947 [Habropoda laboriosa]